MSMIGAYIRTKRGQTKMKRAGTRVRGYRGYFRPWCRIGTTAREPGPGFDLTTNANGNTTFQNINGVPMSISTLS